MELDVSKLAADGLRLELDGPGDKKRIITLEPSQGVTGRYVSKTKAYRIDASSDDALAFGEIRWPAGAVDVHMQAGKADRPTVNVKVKRAGGAQGQIGAKEIAADKLELAFEALDMPIVLRKLTMDRPGLALADSALALVCQKASIERVELHLGGVEVVLHGVNLTGLRVRRGQGVWLVLADAIHARRIAVKLGDITLIAENVQSQTVGLDGKVIRLARLFAPRAHVSGARLASRPQPSGEAPQAQKRAPLSLEALDGLDGKIDVDLTADATVPLIGHRRATHHFRIAVDSGTVNYHRLEKSLSALEDAVLDFEIRGNDLVLERDIPLIKNKALVSWPLGKRDLALAQRQLIRIATLLNYRVEKPSEPQVHEKKRGFELRELSFDGLDVELSLAGGIGLDLPSGGRLELGEDGRPALDELAIRGNLRYKPGTSDRTKLDISASMLNVGLSGVPAGARSLSIASITVDALEKGSIRFAGLKPDGLDATLRDVEVLSVRLVPEP